MNVKHSVIINKPVEEVFAFVTDLRNETRWQPNVQEIRIVSDDTMHKGISFVEIRRLVWRDFVWTFEVTEFIPNARYCFQSTFGTAPSKGCRTFEAVNGGTRITEESEVTLSGLYEAFAPILNRLWQRSREASYNRLKAMLER